MDPDKKELKGQVPWSANMATKYLSFKKFEIQTPNRTYDLQDPQGGAIDWCQCLDAVKEKFFTKWSPILVARNWSHETFIAWTDRAFIACPNGRGYDWRRPLEKKKLPHRMLLIYIV